MQLFIIYFEDENDDTITTKGIANSTITKTNLP